MCIRDSHIGVATLTVSQAEDTYRGAERLIKEYGDVANGGMIKHVTMPDNFMSEMETTISQIVGLADDPKMKVIVVDDAIPGTTEALSLIHIYRLYGGGGAADYQKGVVRSTT